MVRKSRLPGWFWMRGPRPDKTSCGVKREEGIRVGARLAEGEGDDKGTGVGSTKVGMAGFLDCWFVVFFGFGFGLECVTTWWWWWWLLLFSLRSRSSQGRPYPLRGCGAKARKRKRRYSGPRFQVQDGWTIPQDEMAVSVGTAGCYVVWFYFGTAPHRTAQKSVHTYLARQANRCKLSSTGNGMGPCNVFQRKGGSQEVSQVDQRNAEPARYV